MKVSESKYLSICSFLNLVLCIRYVVSSYDGVASTTSPHKPLKFYMQPWHGEVKRFKAGNDHLRADVIPNESSVTMLVNISFGNPPVPQLLRMDTGSDITWIQCASCTKCFKQSPQLYDPLKSGTYQGVNCSSKFCGHTLGCNESSKICTYEVKYLDETGSKGILGTDQLTFTTSGHGTMTEGGVVYGCGMENSVVNPHVDYGSGILGLNAGLLSLPAQKGRRFSYCIGDLNNRSYPYNQLIIGDGAKFFGYKTPLDVYRDYYYMFMEGIRVGKELLDIDSQIFQRSSSGRGGMVIDSGATNSYLPRVAYEALKEKVSSLIGSSMKRWYTNDKNTDDSVLCYYLSFKNQTAGVPVVKFIFAGFAEIELKQDSLFRKLNWYTTCMAVRPAKDGQPGIVGLVAQQKYNVGYDLDKKTLYLSNALDCENIQN